MGKSILRSGKFFYSRPETAASAFQTVKVPKRQGCNSFDEKMLKFAIYIDRRGIYFYNVYRR